MNPSNLSLRQKSRATVVKTIAIHLYGARDPNYIVYLTLPARVFHCDHPRCGVGHDHVCAIFADSAPSNVCEFSIIGDRGISADIC